MQILLWSLNISVAVAFFSTFFWILRWKYQRDLDPSKKYPQGRIIAEFWTESGPRYTKLVSVKTNGWEIEVPSGHQAPRYVFDRSSMGMTKYPTQPLFPFRFLQIDSPVVSWYENYPDAIKHKPGNCPECHAIILLPEQTLTAESLDLLRATDALIGADAISDEMATTQRELAKANANRLNKTFVMILLIAAVAGAVFAAVFAYQGYNAIQLMRGS